MHQAPYTYAGLCAAIDEYNRLHPTEHAFGMGTVEQQKAEIAAFLGNVLHESDQFKAPREYLPCGDSKVVNGKTYCKPCEAGNFDWASRQCRSSMLANGGVFASYCDTARSPPDACSCGSVSEAGLSEELAGYMEADKAFFGRGAIQLSWNYNYIRASTALTGSPDTFCTNPDLVATTEKYAWGAGLFFWMENLKTVQGSNDALSTCHIQSLSGDMGGTLWNINGGQECPAISDWHVKAVVMRINHYCRAATVMEVSSLLSFGGCVGMSEAYAQCDASVDLSQGGCPDCAIWKHGSTSHAPVTSTTTASTVLTTRPETTTSGLLGSSSATTTSTQALISTVRVSTSATGSDITDANHNSNCHWHSMYGC
jgi:predicted chitinase